MSYIDRSKTRPGTTRRVRMLGHDYSYPGFYFVTICTDERQPIFGTIVEEQFVPSPAGLIVQQVISETKDRFSNVSIDAHVVMPNHAHVLIGMSVRLEDDRCSTRVSDVVRWLKNTSVRRYGIGIRTRGWRPYEGRLWQEGFHDHIVRDDRELETLRNYIANNVYMWEKDTFNDGDVGMER